MKTKSYLLDTNICISMLKNKYGIREAILRVKADWLYCYPEWIDNGNG